MPHRSCAGQFLKWVSGAQNLQPMGNGGALIIKMKWRYILSVFIHWTHTHVCVHWCGLAALSLFSHRSTRLWSPHHLLTSKISFTLLWFCSGRHWIQTVSCGCKWPKEIMRTLIHCQHVYILLSVCVCVRVDQFSVWAKPSVLVQRRETFEKWYVLETCWSKKKKIRENSEENNSYTFFPSLIMMACYFHCNNFPTIAFSQKKTTSHIHISLSLSPSLDLFVCIVAQTTMGTEKRQLELHNLLLCDCVPVLVARISFFVQYWTWIQMSSLCFRLEIVGHVCGSQNYAER